MKSTLNYIAIVISIIALVVSLTCCCGCKKHGKKFHGPRHGHPEMVAHGEHAHPTHQAPEGE